jgi:hypothetical protein
MKEIRIRRKPLKDSDRRGKGSGEGNDPFDDEADGSGKTKSRTRDILRIQAHHGDIIIQEGSALQQHYQVFRHIVRTDDSMRRYRKG